MGLSRSTVASPTNLLGYFRTQGVDLAIGNSRSRPLGPRQADSNPMSTPAASIDCTVASDRDVLVRLLAWRRRSTAAATPAWRDAEKTGRRGVLHPYASTVIGVSYFSRASRSIDIAEQRIVLRPREVEGRAMRAARCSRAVPPTPRSRRRRGCVDFVTLPSPRSATGRIQEDCRTPHRRASSRSTSELSTHARIRRRAEHDRVLPRAFSAERDKEGAAQRTEAIAEFWWPRTFDADRWRSRRMPKYRPPHPSRSAKCE